MKIVTENIQWLDEHDDVTIDEYKQQQKNMEDIIRPILVMAYQSSQPSQYNQPSQSSGPTVEEID